MFGESLGAWTSQDAFAGPRAPPGSIADGVDYAIWIGTPYMSKWKEQVLHDDGADIDRRLVGVFDNIGEWHALGRRAIGDPLRDDHPHRRRRRALRARDLPPRARVAGTARHPTGADPEGHALGAHHDVLPGSRST